MMPIVKIIVCWTLRLNLLKDTHIDLLYIFTKNLTLIYATFNLNVSLTLIYV
jgi:hypothetical protein